MTGRLLQVLFALALVLARAPARADEVGTLRARIAELEAALARSEQRCADAPAAAARAWEDPERWQRLERGMTRFRVFELLGEPGKVAQYDGFERWEYPDFLGGRVNFDDRGRVKGWRAP